MDKFIKKLKELWEMDDIKIGINEDSFDYDNSIVQDVVGDACTYLIADNGCCNVKNIETVKKNGFKVYAGEVDSFGWLTGVIEKDGFKLIYG